MIASVARTRTNDLPPDCGADLDDFAPCACTLAPRARPSGAKPKWGMREMVAHKLEQKRAREALKGS